MADMDNMWMDKHVNEYLAWLDNQFRNALDASDSDAPSEYQEGLTDGKALKQTGRE